MTGIAQNCVCYLLVTAAIACITAETTASVQSNLSR